jgi:hypothetical protein
VEAVHICTKKRTLVHETDHKVLVHNHWLSNDLNFDSTGELGKCWDWDGKIEHSRGTNAFTKKDNHSLTQKKSAPRALNDTSKKIYLFGFQVLQYGFNGFIQLRVVAI